ncbi:MAG: outer membrane protein assembly factor [Planctomycetota bacterium]
MRQAWALLLVFAISISAGFLRADGPVIVEIRVEGLQKLSPEYLTSRMSLKVGVPFDPEAASRDLERLYLSEWIRQVSIDKEEVPGGLRLVVRVEEVPRILRVRFEGLRHLKRSDLTKKIREGGLPDFPDDEGDIYGAPLNDGILADIVAAVEQACLMENFSDARVETEIVRSRYGVDLILRMKEEKMVVIEDFTIEGGPTYSQRYIEENTSLFTKEQFLFFDDGLFDRSFLEEDILQIIGFYRDRGYMDVTVDAVVTRQDVQPGFFMKLFNMPPRDEMNVTLKVREGPLYAVGDVKVSGSTQFTKDEVLKAFEIKPGDIYTARDLRKARERVESIYGDKGFVPETYFPDPVLTSIQVVERPDARTRTINLEVRIREGQKVKIRDLTIRGNEKTRDEVIRREMLGLVPGGNYEWSAHQEALRRLKNLDYFEPDTGLRLMLDPNIGKTERDLILEVDEAQTGSFTFGVSMSSEGDFNGNLGINQSNYDVTDISGFPFNVGDFFRNRQYVGKGQIFSMNLSPGTRTSTYSVSLYEPWIFGYPVGLGGSLSSSTTEYDSYSVERIGGALTLSRRWYLGPQEMLSVGIRYRNEQVEIKDIEFDAPSFIINGDPDFLLNGLMPFVAYDSRDNGRIPTEGQLHELAIERTGGFMGGIDFHRVTLKNGFYWTAYTTPEDDKHVLALLSRIDWEKPYGETAEIPIFERFFLGGMQTLRGYKLNTIGPKENDVPYGGIARHHGSLEYIVPLVGNHIRGVAFVDYGTLHVQTPDDWFSGYRFGTGLGLRILVPKVNFPVAIELAEPVGPRSDHEDTRFFNFSLKTSTSF